MDLLTEWAFKQANRVMGVTAPSEALTAWQRYRTDDISPLVTQDVLLMAGTKDHYVPLHQLSDQLLTLSAAPSVSARSSPKPSKRRTTARLATRAWLSE